MAKTEIKIYAKDQEDKTITTTISNVNPETQPSVLKSFAQQLNALTKNTYDRTDRTDTIDIATATDKQSLVLTGLKYKIGDAQAVEFTLSDLPLTITIPDTDFASKKKISLYWTSGATSMSRPIVARTTTDGTVSSVGGIQYWQGQSTWVDILTFSSADTQTFTYNIQYAADDTHLANDTTITINLVSG